MNKTSLIITAIIVLLVAGGGAFYGGMVYGKSQNARPVFAAGNFQGARGNRTGINGDNFVSGNIISRDNNSITLQIPNNGGSKIIFYSNTTQISKMTSGTADDLATGTSISVTGKTNSDGSVTAQSIQIRPADQTRPGSQNSGQ